MAARRSWKGLVLNVSLTLLAFGLLGWTVWSNREKLARRLGEDARPRGCSRPGWRSTSRP